ncbi:MAG: hypothetical protein ACP5E9_08510 [Candidatus Methanospirareceae archaeon]
MINEKGSIVISLTPSESRRLIAKAVANLDVVQHALQHGTIVIGLGTTNAYVAEELLRYASGADKEFEKQRYAAGVITPEGLCVVPKEARINEIILRNGTVSKERIGDAIETLTADDVFIKGANALDATGTAGVLMANRLGGTIGAALGSVMARGVQFIIPVGLEKTIPYPVADAAKRVGIDRCERTLGWPVGLMPMHGRVITELDALKILGADDAFPIGAGGINGGEGSIVICCEGTLETLDRVLTFVRHLKGEAPVRVVSTDCL